ncbi:methyl-accepting chemotaxis protein [Paenibacillus sp. CC-CFT747]|nr:methyl-accepting chemotaxis protein [Paenibacillus sp. CC-CFT747]
MGIIRSITLKARLVGSFAAIVAVFVGAAVFNSCQLNRMAELQDVQTAKLSLKQMAMELKVQVQEMKDLSSGLMISRQAIYIEKYRDQRPSFTETIRRIGDSAETEEQMLRRSLLITASVEYLETFDRAVKVIQDPGLTPVDVQTNIESMYKQAQEQRDRIFELVDGFYQDYLRDSEEAVQAASRTMEESSRVLTASSAAAVVFTLAVSFLLTRSFSRPIRVLQAAVARLAEGDLRQRIGSASRDELGQLSQSFDRMTERVQAMLGQSREIASTLAGHSRSLHAFSEQTSAANADIQRAIEEISSGTAQQAGQAETSASLIAGLEEEMEGIRSSTEGMRNAVGGTSGQLRMGSLSMQALGEAASHSEELLEQAVRDMNELALHSAEIGTITKTISEVSKQTHILALNAAIEASRAGEQGRGFSVIAEEVRKLSLETEQSSRRIGEMVESLQTQTRKTDSNLAEVREGLYAQNRQVAVTLGSFEGIRLSMEDVDGRMRDITEGCRPPTPKIAGCPTRSATWPRSLKRQRREQSRSAPPRRSRTAR